MKWDAYNKYGANGEYQKMLEEIKLELENLRSFTPEKVIKLLDKELRLWGVDWKLEEE